MGAFRVDEIIRRAQLSPEQRKRIAVVMQKHFGRMKSRQELMGENMKEMARLIASANRRE